MDTITLPTALDVSRSESNTSRFGRVVTYTVRIDGVTFNAERMVGLNDHHIVHATIGRCGMSFSDHLGTIPAGRGIKDKFAALAAELHQSRAFVKDDIRHPYTAPDGRRPHADMCTDPAECGRYAESGE